MLTKHATVDRLLIGVAVQLSVLVASGKETVTEILTVMELQNAETTIADNGETIGVVLQIVVKVK